MTRKLTELELILTGKTDSHIHWLTDNIGIHKDMVSSFNKMQLAAKTI